MRNRALAAAIASILLCVPIEARAQDPTAAELRDKAQAAMAGGDVPGACQLYEQSYQAAQRATAIGGTSTPAPDEVLFDLAGCHEKQGKTSEAATEYDRIAGAAGPRAAEAKQRAEALRQPPPPPLAPTIPTPPPPVPTPPAVVIAPPAIGLGGPTAPPPPAAEKEEAPTRIGDFMDTRLTWTFGDDDVLKATGQAFPLSPDASIDDRKQYRLFFDNLNSRFGGRENLTHLALYKKMPGFIDNLDTEASLILRFDIGALSKTNAGLNQSLYDAGSYIRGFYHTRGGAKGKEGLGLTLWPLDTDRFRLGYLYEISWGGTSTSLNQSIFPRKVGSSPGAKIQYDHEAFSIYAGFKTATIKQIEQTVTPGTSEVETVNIEQTNYGFLGGAGVNLGDWVHVDLGGGYFQQGKFDLPDVAGQRAYTFGGSARLVVHHPDMPVAQSIDFQLYRNDPNKAEQIFKPEKYEEGKTTWSASLEASNLVQNLKDFDVAGATALQAARAVAVQGNLKSGYFRASLSGLYRDLPFVLRNQPSMIPFQTLPADAKTGNEIFLALAVDYYIKAPRLTPGLGFGFQAPATFGSSSVDNSGAQIEHTVVVREQGNLAILPINATAVPIIQGRFSLKWDISKILSALAWIQYVRDNNGTFVERDPNEATVALRTFVSPDFLGLGTSVQARF